MSKEQAEQKSNYMSQLDEWTEKTVLEPLYYAFPAEDKKAIELVKKAIREKVLESYRNGKGTPQRSQYKRAKRF